MQENIIQSELKYKGKVLSMQDVRIDFGNGNVANYERVVFNKDATGIIVVPLLSSEKLVFLEQYQVGQEGRTLVFPRGGAPEKSLDSLEEYANVELQEEVGYKAKSLVKLGILRPMPGYMVTDSVVYLGLDLEKSSLQSGDEHESLLSVILTFREAVEKVFSLEITDARTIASLFMAREYLNLHS